MIINTLEINNDQSSLALMSIYINRDIPIDVWIDWRNYLPWNTEQINTL